MRKSIVRVGLDSEATIHKPGTVVQVQATSGSPEKTVTRSAIPKLRAPMEMEPLTL